MHLARIYLRRVSLALFIFAAVLLVHLFAVGSLHFYGQNAVRMATQTVPEAARHSDILSADVKRCVPGVHQSMLPDALNNVLRATRIAPVLIDAAAVKCIDDGAAVKTSTRHDSKCGVRLGLFADDFDTTKAALLNVKLPAGWHIRILDDAMLVRNNKSALFFTRILHDRKAWDYWLFPHTAVDDCRTESQAVLVPELDRIAVAGVPPLLYARDAAFYLWQLATAPRHIECNNTLARHFLHSTWPKDIQKMHQEQYYKPLATWTEAIATMRDIMYGIRVPVMLAMGTLLGWYRNCDWIPYTTDVDMAFFANDFTPEIELAFRKHKDAFYLSHIFGLPQDGYEMTLYYKDSHYNDLFAVYNENNQSWVGSTNNAHPADLPKHRWYFPAITSLCTGDFRGRLFMVPCNVVDVFDVLYGSDWRLAGANHGVGIGHVFMGYWPNATRHLTERKRYIVCWNGGVEVPKADGVSCKCATGYTGKYCQMHVPLKGDRS